MSHIKRRIAAAGIVLAQLHDPESWEGSGAGNYELLRQVLLVGESLARLGTAEFGERSNSSRAINTKDYATLLQHVSMRRYEILLKLQHQHSAAQKMGRSF